MVSKRTAQRLTPAQRLVSAFAANGRPLTAHGYFILDAFFASIGEITPFDERDIPDDPAARTTFLKQHQAGTRPLVKGSDPAFCVLKTVKGDYVPVTHMVKPKATKDEAVKPNPVQKFVSNKSTDADHGDLKRNDYTYLGWVTVNEAINAGIHTFHDAKLFAQRWGHDEKKAYKKDTRSLYTYSPYSVARPS